MSQGRLHPVLKNTTYQGQRTGFKTCSSCNLTMNIAGWNDLRKRALPEESIIPIEDPAPYRDRICPNKYCQKPLRAVWNKNDPQFGKWACDDCKQYWTLE